MGKRIITDEQKQARHEYNKRYRAEHKEIELKRQKRFRENHPDKLRENQRRYRETHPNAKRDEYDRLLTKQGKVRRPILTDEEKEIKRLIQKEQNRIRAHERYVKNFVSVEKVCKYCGTPFMTEYKKSKMFCSEECAHKHSHYLSKLAEKRRKGKITALEKLDSDITLPLLFQRDKGICKICGTMCDWKDVENKNGFAVVGENYPSIDHIIPISKGGSHTWDNVQLAHKRCNSIKSNK